jgi:Ca2+-binding EF-hand superfamily protein
MTAAKGKGSISWLLLLILVSATASPNDELEKAEMFLGES